MMTYRTLGAVLFVAACDKAPATILDRDIDWGDCTFKQVEASEGSTCVVTMSNEVACWDTVALSPLLPHGAVESLAEGTNYYLCGIEPDGELICWIDTVAVVLSYDSYDWGFDFGEGAEAVALAVPPGQFVQMARDWRVGCARDTTGNITCFGEAGWPDLGMLNPPTGAFTDLDVARSHGCGIRTDGTVACWGWTFDAYNSALEDVPSIGEFPTGVVENTPTDAGYVQVETGAGRGCVLDIDGVIHCWDSGTPFSTPYNSDGSEGDGALVGPFSHFAVSENSVQFNACGVNLDGDVECTYKGWSSSTPTSFVPGPFASVSIGSTHACALGADGHVTCWDTLHAASDSDNILAMPCEL